MLYLTGTRKNQLQLVHDTTEANHCTKKPAPESYCMQIHSEANTIQISTQDTDVLLQLVAHCDKFQCDQLWMKSGTAKTIQHFQ